MIKLIANIQFAIVAYDSFHVLFIADTELPSRNKKSGYLHSLIQTELCWQSHWRKKATLKLLTRGLSDGPQQSGRSSTVINSFCAFWTPGPARSPRERHRRPPPPFGQLEDHDMLPHLLEFLFTHVVTRVHASMIEKKIGIEWNRKLLSAASCPKESVS